MRIVLSGLLIADGIILLASLATRQGWAHLVCANTLDMCSHPRWLIALAVVLGGTLLVMRIAR